MSDSSPPKRLPIHCHNVSQAIAEGYRLAILCKLCSYRRVVAAEPLHALCKARIWSDDFIGLSNRMKCTGCGGKLANIVAVNEAPDKGRPVGIKSEAEYKALIRKMRD